MMKAIKKLLIALIVLVLVTFESNAQSSDYITAGIKGGVNLSSISYDKNYSVNVSKTLGMKSGYQLGAYARLGKTFFIQPEVYFSAKDFEVNALNLVTKSNDVVAFSQKTLDVPVLLGIKLGPLRLAAGPVASYSFSADASADNALKTYFSGSAKEITNRSNFSYQAGVGLDILSLSIDVRYESALSDLSNTIKVPSGFSYSQKPSFFLATIGFRIL
jgi:hypothetical protein